MTLGGGGSDWHEHGALMKVTCVLIKTLQRAPLPLLPCEGEAHQTLDPALPSLQNFE